MKYKKGSCFMVTVDKEEFYRNIFNELKNNRDTAVQKFDKIISQVDNKLECVYWTFPIKIGVHNLYELVDIDKAEDIETYLSNFYLEDNYKNYDYIIKNIRKSKHIEKYVKLVDECDFCFKNEKYISSSISFISIIEGILSSFNDDKNRVKMIQTCKEQLNRIPADVDKLIEKQVWNSCVRFIEKLYKKSDFKKTEPSNINRHWLLHGRSNYNLTVNDCLRLFNTITSICYLLDNTYS